MPAGCRLRQVPRHSLSDSDIEEVAAAAHGYVGSDLAALVNEAALVALRRYLTQQQDSSTGAQPAAASSLRTTPPAAPLQLAELCVTREDLGKAESRVRPSALRELAVEVPRVTWADVGGMEHVKQQ